MRGIPPASEPLARLEAWIACCLALPDTAKERLKCSCHPFERLLRGLGGQGCLFLLPEHRQVTTLLRKAQRDALAPPGGTALLQGSVIQTAVGFALGLQRGCLCWRRIQAIGDAAIDRF